MQIQPVTNQPNFNGRLIFEHATTKEITTFVPEPLYQRYKEIAAMVSEKPYDIFISRNKQNSDFYNVAANKTLEKASKIKEYTVKVQSNVFVESVVDAAKEAMDMYEKYIAKKYKG